MDFLDTFRPRQIDSKLKKIYIESNNYDHYFDDLNNVNVTMLHDFYVDGGDDNEKDNASCQSCQSSPLLGACLGGQARRQASIQICPRPISTQNPVMQLAEPDHGGKRCTLIGGGRLSWDEARVGYRKWKHPAADSNSGTQAAAEFGKCF